MARPVVFRREVGRDLATVYRWYEEQRPGLDEEFVAAIDAAFDAIEQFPEMFSAVHGEVRRAIVSRFPYCVFYQIQVSRVVVRALVHTAARDPRRGPKPRSHK